MAKDKTDERPSLSERPASDPAPEKPSKTSRFKSLKSTWSSISNHTSAAASSPPAETPDPETPPEPEPTPVAAGDRSSSFKSFFSKAEKGAKETKPVVRELCERCCQIDFDQFAAPTKGSPEEEETTKPKFAERDGPEDEEPKGPPPPTTSYILPLFDVIEKSGKDGKGCAFCNFLLDALALPENDPFLHPAIRDHMPTGFEFKTFDSWVKNLRGSRWLEKMLTDAHPFGKSRNKIDIEIDETDTEGTITEVRREDIESRGRAAILGSVALGSMGPLGFVIGFAINNSVYRMSLDSKLPVVIRVKIHNVHDTERRGLVSISVHGYGGRVQAPLSVLSSFTLRIASDYQEDGLGLRYGRIIENRVNIEDDCRRWLNDCCERHGAPCASPEWHVRLPLPSGRHFRLIEIAEDRDDMCKIVQLDTSTTPLPDYVALSYVWGAAGAKGLNLKHANLAELSERIPPERLPKTIADAITVTRRLGLRYIWIDSLCIIQDDVGSEEPGPHPSPFDQMGSIYGHAKVAIIAAGGEDAGFGLAGVSDDREPGQTAQEVKPDINVMMPIPYDESYGKWDTRAWTLQEKLLSRRMLVFTERHVSFHCRHGVLREDMPGNHAGTNHPPKMPYLDVSQDNAEDRAKFNWDGSASLLRSPYFNEYVKVLDQYTWRHRSNSNDVIRAMLGLLNVLGELKGIESPDALPRSQEEPPAPKKYRRTLYGLPEEFLDLALLWQPPAVVGTRLTKRTDQNFPTWSWAGWDLTTKEDPCTMKSVAYRARIGIRFEEPFRVSGADDLSLRKFVTTTDSHAAEERLRPMVLWYKWVVTDRLQPDAGGELVPVNGNGLGVVCGEEMGQWLLKEPLRLHGEKPAGPPSIKPGISLSAHNLVCETQVGRFWLRHNKDANNNPAMRQEALWAHGEDKQAVVDKELEIVEIEMLDASGNVVGYIIPTDQQFTVNPQHPYPFMLLSSSQYWGNEGRIDVIGYPLYNVMMIEWDAKKEFAIRLGLGKIARSAWDVETPSVECVVLR